MTEFLGAALQIMGLMVLTIVVLIGALLLAVILKGCWDVWREGRRK